MDEVCFYDRNKDQAFDGYIYGIHIETSYVSNKNNMDVYISYDICSNRYRCNIHKRIDEEYVYCNKKEMLARISTEKLINALFKKSEVKDNE